MDELINSYLVADYFVEGFESPIKVGKTSKELDQLLTEHSATTWCYITAFNPFSEELSPNENLVRNDNLREELRGFVVVDGESVDLDGNWKPERSFLVLGIDRDTSVLLADKFRQRAIVYGTKGAPAELVFQEIEEDNDG
ncbi:MAG: DUF3293 domain-containing protein [Pyrinomonadaceae bacterium]